MTGVTVTEFNTDIGLQNALKRDITTAADVVEDQVTIVGAREPTSDESGSSRRLLQDDLIAVDYTIAFFAELEAETAAMQLAEIENLEEVELYLAADYEGAQVESISATVEIVDTEEPKEDDDGLGIEIIAGAAAAGCVVALGGGYFAYSKMKGGRQNIMHGASQRFERDNPGFGVMELTQKSDSVMSIGISDDSEDHALPSGVV